MESDIKLGKMKFLIINGNEHDFPIAKNMQSNIKLTK